MSGSKQIEDLLRPGHQGAPLPQQVGNVPILRSLGRDQSMTQRPDDMVKLVLRRQKSGAARYLNAWRATADFYGWTEAFDVWTPPIVYSEGGNDFHYWPKRSGRGHARGGKNIRICRSPSRAGTPKGFTNRFTVSKSCTEFELAEIAHFTKVDWYWMETVSGARLSRDRWEAIYQAWTRE